MGDADGVDLSGDSVMDIRDEKGIAFLLEVEIVHVYGMGRQVSIELRLFRKRSLVNFFAPERMFAKVLPVNTFHGILLK